MTSSPAANPLPSPAAGAGGGPAGRRLRVLVLTRYGRLGASSRLRLLQYVDPLAAAGIDCTVSALLADEELQRFYESRRRSVPALLHGYARRLLTLAGAGRYDCLWVEKELFPLLPATAERLLRLVGVPYVVDYDDAVFHSYDLAPSRVLRMLLGRKIDIVMARARTVVAGNAYLAERARAAGAADVRIIPTVVDPDRYRPAVRQPDSPVTIGWIGSPGPASQGALLAIAPTLARVAARHSARLLVIGLDTSVSDHFPRVRVEVRPWSEERERNDVGEMDIGIMPLPDQPWERGKCGYKLIQYMSSGVAVCASPVGVNVAIVQESGAGLLAASPAEWEAALEKLIVDHQARRRIAARGPAYVRERYSLQSQLGSIVAVLRRAATRREGARRRREEPA